MTRLTAYVPQDEVPVVLSPEASTVLLERLLEEAGGTVIHGATVVVFEEADRQDVVIFADGKVREVGRHHGEKMAAQRIVDAANGRRRGPGKLEMEHDPRPMLPEGVETMVTPDEASSSHYGTPWRPYEVGAGVWMAHDQDRDRFDVRYTWASRGKASQRCHWLNAHTDGLTGEVRAPGGSDEIPDF